MRPYTPIGIGTAIVLITVGAILRFAITEGNIGFLDIEAMGNILLIIGILALVIAIVWTIMLSSRDRPAAYDERREVVREREPREVVREREYEEPTRRRERF